ncbi:hypothetical protein UA75_14900 [Actinoalloteichus sp. GBA129-24]|uniref:Uncharacterized protein n=1 Tax=Actinoalloteichus fjordicus TaxID=1612552 RepID=A0AAC9LEM8_9PSEU|nr:hypothetical protein UA74_14310 [Actinoalloteichus fjordicus]APU20990.1 hypothetical protein UA75_14900 [Actinoalloteichus sp. GBA129-24]
MPRLFPDASNEATPETAPGTPERRAPGAGCLRPVRRADARRGATSTDPRRGSARRGSAGITAARSAPRRTDTPPPRQRDAAGTTPLHHRDRYR